MTTGQIHVISFKLKPKKEPEDVPEGECATATSVEQIDGVRSEILSIRIALH